MPVLREKEIRRQAPSFYRVCFLSLSLCPPVVWCLSFSLFLLSFSSKETCKGDWWAPPFISRTCSWSEEWWKAVITIPIYCFTLYTALLLLSIFPTLKLSPLLKIIDLEGEGWEKRRVKASLLILLSLLPHHHASFSCWSSFFSSVSTSTTPEKLNMRLCISTSMICWLKAFVCSPIKQENDISLSWLSSSSCFWESLYHYYAIIIPLFFGRQKKKIEKDRL